MFSKIKLGMEEWKKLEADLERISSGAPLELVINLTLVASGGEEKEEEEEHHHHHVHEIDNDFTREVAKLIDYIAHTYNAHVHPHVHANHGSVMFAVKGAPKDLLKALREVLDFVKLNCEKCLLHSLDGEFHLGEDLSGIYFGDSYKITVIVPAEDGKRLKVHEVHF
ncbi:hypothetical protein [Pyrobaculum aerophilum]|uniref:Uncharacterized protein n=1 Tax=Pyrobaculum aerophilum TaxID=13773 RepID=A0A371R442_9CREN|nr:hypothetical protein [Pyrobaculum aerophilum]RFA98540.1 hypothetical protein CGL51_00475 [Pyrobaculum aerophilum]RFA99244.1 hypothetical protein CGL52_04435 [Pyrobaculum aerophilum]